MPRIRERSCRNCRPGACLAIAVVLVSQRACSQSAALPLKSLTIRPQGRPPRVPVLIRSGVEFFEKNVRPILSARCQGCHGPAKQKGGLRLDARATVLAGGSTGPAVVPGNPKESLLVDAINYGETYQMPPKSKLPPEEIATLTEWVQRGAPWGIGTRRRDRIIRRRQDSGRPLEGRIRRHGLASGASSRSHASRPRT